MQMFSWYFEVDASSRFCPVKTKPKIAYSIFTLGWVTIFKSQLHRVTLRQTSFGVPFLSRLVLIFLSSVLYWIIMSFFQSPKMRKILTIIPGKWLVHKWFRFRRMPFKALSDYLTFRYIHPLKPVRNTLSF